MLSLSLRHVIINYLIFQDGRQLTTLEKFFSIIKTTFFIFIIHMLGYKRAQTFAIRKEIWGNFYLHFHVRHNYCLGIDADWEHCWQGRKFRGIHTPKHFFYPWQGSFKVSIVFISSFYFHFFLFCFFPEEKALPVNPTLLENRSWDTQQFLNPCVENLLFTKKGFPHVGFSSQVVCITILSAVRNGFYSPYLDMVNSLTTLQVVRKTSFLLERFWQQVPRCGLMSLPLSLRSMLQITTFAGHSASLNINDISVLVEDQNM